LVAAVTAIPRPLCGQSARYSDILAMYRHGEFDAAIVALSRLSRDERYRGAREVLRSSLRPFRRDVVQAVLTLHTDLSFATHVPVDCTSQESGFELFGAGDGVFLDGPPFFDYALLYLLKTRFPDDQFLLSWYLTVIAFSQNWEPGGIDCYRNAPSRFQRHPEMLIALGAMHEMTWMEHETQGWSPPILKPSLQTAERAYREVLQTAPDLGEARLRLGRVLGLQSNPDAALQAFSEVRGRLDGGFAYLLTLFEGDAYQQRGDADRAAESYAAAHAMMPRAQSAIIALAHLAFVQGRRTEALERIGEVNDAAAAGASRDPWDWYAQGVDPWSWYQRGIAWRFPMYREKLRALVKTSP
jgi:tetratricopeptide (TPR) repeat protein